MARKLAKNENDKWDSQRVSDGYLSTARDAEIYLDEIREKVKSNPSYEVIYDEYLAKFFVYNYLHGRTFLDTKQALVSELRSMLARPALDSKVYDAARFKKYYCVYVQEVLRNLESSET